MRVVVRQGFYCINFYLYLRLKTLTVNFRELLPSTDVSLKETFSAILDQSEAKKQKLYNGVLALCSHPDDIHIICDLVCGIC